MPLFRSSLHKWIAAAGLLLIAGAIWWWMSSRESPAAAGKGGAAPVSVTTVRVEQRDFPVVVTANGTVVSLQAVDIRAQTTGTVKAIHIAEGQSVKAGDLLVTLDARNEEAARKRADAQVLKTRSDLANAERNLKRQRELFEQKFISQSALDAAATALDVLKGQLAVDEAAAEASRVAQSLMEIRAPFAGRTGSIAVRAGSVVVPNGAPMLSLVQIDPIAVSFALPERELSHVQRAMAAGPVAVDIALPTGGGRKGTLTLFENAVDAATGTIGMKASVPNDERTLWPGMFVNVALTTRTLKDALVVPVQAVQSGPERQFVYAVGEGGKVTNTPVTVQLTQDGFAVVSGVAVGARLVAEGAQNVRSSSIVKEAVSDGKGGRDKKSPGAKSP